MKSPYESRKIKHLARSTGPYDLSRSLDQITAANEDRRRGQEKLARQVRKIIKGK